KKTAELDLRPGIQDPTKSGVPGGEYPYWVAIRGDATIYVSSPRDREIVVVQLGSSPWITGRIPVRGQPKRIVLNRPQNRLFVRLDNAGAVAIVDTETNRVIGDINVAVPPDFVWPSNFPKGANPNSIALSPDEQTLYVTDGG